MGLFDVFKKSKCGVCEEEYSLSSMHEIKDGHICKSCSKYIGLGEKFDIKFTGSELANIAVSPEQILKYRIASHIAVNPGIALGYDELCLFVSMGEVGKEKTRTVTTKKGNKTQKDTENYWAKFLCRLFITDQRIIALADRNGFEIKLNKLIDIQFENDKVVFFTGTKTYVVFLVKDQINKLKTIWGLLANAGELKIDIDNDNLDYELMMTADVEAYRC